MSTPIDHSGRVFTRLRVIERYSEGASQLSHVWICLCDPDYGGCGKVTKVHISNLKGGNTKSCGCLHKEAVTKHGFRHLSEYSIWLNMLARCYNPKHPHYDNYGGRGITMSDEWRESFETFYRDMGPRPSPEYSIDRKDNDKGYFKDNCRWATNLEQQNNKRCNLVYEFDGEKKTLSEWCRELRVDYFLVYYYLQTSLPFEDALDKVIAKKTRPHITKR